MHKILTALLISLSMPYMSAAQSETASSAEIGDQFQKLYNAEDYEEIFTLFAPVMQKALPLDKTLEFMNQLMSQVGKIKKRSFLHYEQSYACYKSEYERGILQLNISLDDKNQINGLFFKPYVDNSAPSPDRNSTEMILPCIDEWTVYWGGDTRALNYHVDHPAQNHAFDLIITDDTGASYAGSGGANEDYYAFGKPIIAPCAAEVMLVVDGIKDNVPGILNPVFVPGNTVVLRSAEHEYIYLAHFKQHTIEVAQGDRVERGQLLGLCGNSGNSSEPHLHFHLQNVEEMHSARGIKCYFSKLLINGKEKSDYSPIKGEKAKNITSE